MTYSQRGIRVKTHSRLKCMILMITNPSSLDGRINPIKLGSLRLALVWYSDCNMKDKDNTVSKYGQRVWKYQLGYVMRGWQLLTRYLFNKAWSEAYIKNRPKLVNTDVNTQAIYDILLKIFNSIILHYGQSVSVQNHTFRLIWRIYIQSRAPFKTLSDWNWNASNLKCGPVD